MIDLGLPGYSRSSSRAASRATSRDTSRANSPVGTRSRPTTLTMNYQPRKSAEINETTSQRKANNNNSVVMQSINTHIQGEQYKKVGNLRNKYSNIVNTKSLAKTRIQPPEITDHIQFTNNPKNKNYTMERMPILDETKQSFTFEPNLPKDYLKKDDMLTVKNNTYMPNSTPENRDHNSEEVNVVYKPDEVENNIPVKSAPFVPSWLRNK